jgi:hypothetical protein
MMISHVLDIRREQDPEARAAQSSKESLCCRADLGNVVEEESSRPCLDRESQPASEASAVLVLLRSKLVGVGKRGGYVTQRSGLSRDATGHIA